MKKKNIWYMLLIAIAVALIIASFSLRDVLGSALASDICRIIGFVLLMAYFALAIRNKRS